MKWIDHHNSKHEAGIEVYDMKFDSYKLFLAWKEEEEYAQNSQYVQKCAPQTNGKIKTWYFYCNRAGQYVHRGSEEKEDVIQILHY